MRQNDVHGAQACNEYEYVWGVSFRLIDLMRKEERISHYLHRSMAGIASEGGLPALTLIYVDWPWSSIRRYLSWWFFNRVQKKKKTQER
jgi:hypothetical protein